MLRIFILMIMALGMTGVNGLELPPEFRAQYVVKKGPFELGRSLRQLSYTESGELVFHTESSSTGLVSLFYSENIRETTRLKPDGQALLPVEYRYQREGRRDRTITQNFDWQSNNVASQVNETLYEFALQPGTNDPNGYQVNLMLDLARGERAISYPVARKNKLRIYEINHVGDEQLDTVVGRLDTVVIQRKSDKTTTMWCAPALHYLPVKIQHEEDGGVFTAYLDSLEGMQPRTLPVASPQSE